MTEQNDITETDLCQVRDEIDQLHAEVLARLQEADDLYRVGVEVDRLYSKALVRLRKAAAAERELHAAMVEMKRDDEEG